MSKFSITEVADPRRAPFSVTYIFPAFDFGAGGISDEITAPDGYAGVVKDVSVYSITEVFNAVTTGALIRLGDSSNPNRFYDSIAGEMDALAAGEGFSLGAQAEENRDIIPAGSVVEYIFNAPTGGTPTGIGTVAVTILWFK